MAPFTNCRIYTCVPEALVPGFPRDEVLDRQITNAGGMVADSSETATYIIAHNMQQDNINQLNKDAQLCSIVWYFACFQADKTLSPNDHPLYRPFPFPAIPGAAQYGEVAITGFSNVDRIAAAALIQAAGLEYSKELSLRVPGHTQNQSALLVAKNTDAPAAKTTAARYEIALLHVYIDAKSMFVLDVLQ